MCEMSVSLVGGELCVKCQSVSQVGGELCVK